MRNAIPFKFCSSSRNVLAMVAEFEAQPFSGHETSAWRSRVGLNYPCPLGVKKLECHHR